MTTIKGPDDYIIVLIDGVCHLCQGLTKFIIKRDPSGVFRFASQQSEIGQDILRKGGLDGGLADTVVVVDHGIYYTRSAAVLRIVRHLPMPWPLLYGFVILPKFLRDLLYRWVAKNRYRWFGKDEQCLIPTPEIRRRFL